MAFDEELKKYIKEQQAIEELADKYFTTDDKQLKENFNFMKTMLKGGKILNEQQRNYTIKNE